MLSLAPARIRRSFSRLLASAVVAANLGCVVRVQRSGANLSPEKLRRGLQTSFLYTSAMALYPDHAVEKGKPIGIQSRDLSKLSEQLSLGLPRFEKINSDSRNLLRLHFQRSLPQVRITHIVVTDFGEARIEWTPDRVAIDSWVLRDALDQAGGGSSLKTRLQELTEADDSEALVFENMQPDIAYRQRINIILAHAIAHMLLAHQPGQPCEVVVRDELEADWYSGLVFGLNFPAQNSGAPFLGPGPEDIVGDGLLFSEIASAEHMSQGCSVPLEMRRTAFIDGTSKR